MLDGFDIPDAIAWLIVAGAVAPALFNLGKVLRFLRIPQAIGKVVSWLATIARDAFIEGARDGILEIVRKELRPNGKTNIRDAVDRTETMVRSIDDQVQHIREDLEDHRDDDSAHLRRHDADPDAHGGADRPRR